MIHSVGSLWKYIFITIHNDAMQITLRHFDAKQIKFLLLDHSIYLGNNDKR